MSDVETVARAMRVERIAYRNRISKEEALVIADDGRYTDAELLAATVALAAATPLIEARATAALVDWLRSRGDCQSADDEIAAWLQLQKGNPQ